MIIRSDEEILQECKRLGEAGVEAHLAEGLFHDNPAPARQWLNEKRITREMKNTRSALYASWLLVGITCFGILMQSRDLHEQREDNKTLLEVQISMELDKRFDSQEMRKARTRLAKQLLSKQDITEFRVIDFFDNVAMYKHKNTINKEIVDQSYSYWVTRYWPVIKGHVEKLRKEQKDPSYYDDFEELYNDMVADDKKDGIGAPNEDEVQRFLREEASLSI